jgi:thymidylate synthase (FAD)
MKVVLPKVDLLTNDCDRAANKIEVAARTCYKSEDLITDRSAEQLVKKLIERGHEAMIEHFSVTFRVLCDRGVSHELVRHRIMSFAQESTRYVSYQHGDMEFVLPSVYKSAYVEYLGRFNEPEQHPTQSQIDCFRQWRQACEVCEISYKRMMELGAKPQEARSVLPNSLKTEIIMTANLREWRHFIKLRTAKAAHPDMRVVAKKIYEILLREIPVVFADIEVPE